MALMEDQKKSAEGVLSCLLQGAQLDCFRVYSLELAIGFFGGEVPSAWLSTRQAISVVSSSEQECGGPKDFFHERRLVLGQLHGLIGEYVSVAWIGGSGELFVEFGSGARLIVATDDEEDEILWSVTSDTPSPFEPHDWAVLLLAKKNQLIVRRPR